MSIIQSDDLFAQSFNPRDIVLKALHLKKIAYRCRMPRVFAHSKNSNAVSATDMLLGLITAQFIGDNFNQACKSSAAKLLPCGKSSMYEYMKSTSARWGKLAMGLASQAYFHLKPLSKHEDRCFVVDDSVLEHSGAKRMELCTWLWDHNGSHSVKGYNCLQIGWTDGLSFFPLGAKLVSSTDETQDDKDTTENKENESTATKKKSRKSKKQKEKVTPACPNQKKKVFDHRLHGKQVRKEAQTSKPELVKAWLKQALRSGLDAKYVLMDSWFNYESLLKPIKEMGLEVIGMLKLDQRHYYRLNRKGQALTYRTLSELYQSLKRKCKKAGDIIGSEVVVAATAKETFEDGLKMRLVYVRNRNDADSFLVVASTDTTLSPERIVQLYARRWMIETNFFNQKQFLGLGSETRSTDFDVHNAFANLSCIRATIIEFHRRIHQDIRAAGELFRGATETLREIPVVEAITELVEKFTDELPKKLQKAGCIVKGKEKTVKRIIKIMTTKWYNSLTEYVKTFLENSPKFRLKRKKGSRKPCTSH